jgi:hypothetical protein
VSVDHIQFSSFLQILQIPTYTGFNRKQKLRTEVRKNSNAESDTDFSESWFYLVWEHKKHPIQPTCNVCQSYHQTHSLSLPSSLTPPFQPTVKDNMALGLIFLSCKVLHYNLRRWKEAIVINCDYNKLAWCRKF